MFAILKTKDKKLLCEENKFDVPSPSQIKKEISNMQICPRCQFIIFDNYWTNEIENITLKVCSTCGYKI